MIPISCGKKRRHTGEGSFLSLLCALLLFSPPLPAMAAAWSQSDWSDNDFTSATNVTGSASDLTLTPTAGWWDAGGSQRKPIAVTNAGSTHTDYAVRIAIPYASEMQNDFDDLRFTNAAGSPLDFWLEKKTDGTSAVVWVEIDTLTGAG